MQTHMGHMIKCSFGIWGFNYYVKALSLSHTHTHTHTHTKQSVFKSSCCLSLAVIHREFLLMNIVLSVRPMEKGSPYWTRRCRTKSELIHVGRNHFLVLPTAAYDPASLLPTCTHWNDRSQRVTTQWCEKGSIVAKTFGKNVQMEWRYERSGCTG